MVGSGYSFCSTLVDRIVTGYPRDEVVNWKKNWVITMVFSTPLNTFPVCDSGTEILSD